MDDFEKAILFTFDQTGRAGSDIKAQSQVRHAQHSCANLSPCVDSFHAIAPARQECHVCRCATLPCSDLAGVTGEPPACLHSSVIQRRMPLSRTAPAAAPQAYLDQVRASPDCWRLCLERFEASGYLEVRFWCAQTLSSLARSSYGALPPEARTQLKRALVASGTQPAAAQLPSFLRNKIAQAVVAIAAHEYPDEWPSFFQASARGGGRWRPH